MKYPLQIRMHHLETREQDPEEMISFLPLAAIKRIKRGRAAGTLARKKKKKKSAGNHGDDENDFQRAL